LIKTAGNSAVYYYGPDGNRYAFPNDKVYFTWYDDFKSVITVDFSNMSKIPLGGLVTYRPGVKMVKFITSPHVYVVYKGGELRKIKSEIMAEELYGDNWNKQIDDINDGFFTSYVFGEDIATAEEYSKDGWQAASPNITVDKSI
jgi:hypothetical protein